MSFSPFASHTYAEKNLPKLIDWKECFICQGCSNAESILVKPFPRPRNNYIAFCSVFDAYYDFLYQHTHPCKNTHTLLTNTWTPFSVRHLKFDHLRITLIIGVVRRTQLGGDAQSRGRVTHYIS